MKRFLLTLLPLIIGIAIGSCLAISRGGTRRETMGAAEIVLLHGLANPPATEPPQDWRPVVGRRYERPGSHARTVTEVWGYGVAYRRDGGKERYCTMATWKRWAQQKGGG